MPLILYNESILRVCDRFIINWYVHYSLDGVQVVNEQVEFIKESLPFIVSTKQRRFTEKYEALELLYDLPSLDVPCKYYIIYQTWHLFSF